MINYWLQNSLNKHHQQPTQALQQNLIYYFHDIYTPTFYHFHVIVQNNTQKYKRRSLQKWVIPHKTGENGKWVIYDWWPYQTNFNFLTNLDTLINNTKHILPITNSQLLPPFHYICSALTKKPWQKLVKWSE